MKSEGSALADFLPYLVRQGLNDEVVSANILGDSFIKTGFETTNAVVGVIAVVDFGRWRRAAKIMN